MPTFTIKRFTLTVQRLYLAMFPSYQAFLSDLAQLALWKDYQRSLRYCIVSFIKSCPAPFLTYLRCSGFCGSMIYCFLLFCSGSFLLSFGVVYRLTPLSKNFRSAVKRLREHSSLVRPFINDFQSQQSGPSRCGAFSSFINQGGKIKPLW